MTRANVNHQLSEKKLKELLSFKFESEALEYKVSFDLESHREVVELAKDILAIANSGGGHIVVGVEDGSFRVVGLSEVEAAQLSKSDQVNNKFLKYHGGHISLQTAVHELSEGGGSSKIAAIYVPGAPRGKIPSQAVGAYMRDGKNGKQVEERPILAGDVFIRKGASSRKVSTPTDTLPLPSSRQVPQATDPKAEPQPQPLSRNPYKFNVTAESAMFKGREQEITELLGNFSSSTHVALWGLQRIGKTSLFREARNRCLLDGRNRQKFAEIDLQKLGADKKLSYRDLVGEIVWALSVASGSGASRTEVASGLDNLVEGSGRNRGGRSAYLQSCERALEMILARTSERYVLFLDEFSELCKSIAWRSQLDLGQPDRGFTERPHEMVADIALMRWFSSLLKNSAISEKLTFVLAVRPFVADFDNNNDLEILKLTAPIHLYHLDEKSARELITVPVVPHIQYDRRAIDYLFRLTDGHPYLIQFMLKILVDSCLASGRNRITLRDVEAVEKKMISEGPSFDPHFRVLDRDYGINETLDNRESRLGKGVLACIAKEGHTKVEGWVPKNQIVQRLQDFDVSSETMSRILSQMLGAKIVQESVRENCLCYRVSIPLLRKRYVRQNMYQKYFE